MKTLAAATVAALLAAAITATAANQGEPVHDNAATKQLKELNQKLGASPYSRGLRRTSCFGSLGSPQSLCSRILGPTSARG